MSRLTLILQSFFFLHSGKLKGIRETIEGEELNIFYGIPYGVPPVDELRFKAPKPSEPWEGVLDATQKPNSCFLVFPFMHYFFDWVSCLLFNHVIEFYNIQVHVSIFFSSALLASLLKKKTL